MNVLIACEESQTVCMEFRRQGHEAFSCDLKECSGGHIEYHIMDDCITAINEFNWDFIGFHPDCTCMCVSGNHKYAKGKPFYPKREQAVYWTLKVWDLIKSKAKYAYMENPVSVLFTSIKDKNKQYIQPYNFGHDASKKTCLVLHNLPLLRPTEYILPRIVNGKKRWNNQTDSGQNRLGPSEKRSELRSKTYSGIAAAMAEQWG